MQQQLDRDQLLNLEVSLSDLKNILLRALLKNEVMTAIQMSKLAPLTNGQPLSRLASSRGKRVYYLNSYMKVHKMLNRWNGVEWKRIDQRKNDADIWVPIDSRRRKSKPNEDEFRTTNLLHNLGVSDLYSVLYPHKLTDGQPVMTAWDRDENTSAFEDVHYDAQCLLFGQPFFIEYERGNHPIVPQSQRGTVKPEYYRKSLNHKIDRYDSYFRSHNDRRRYLLITVEDWSDGSYDAGGTIRLMDRILAMLATSPMADRYLVAAHRSVIGDKDEVDGELHNEVLGDPFGDVWAVADDPDNYTSIQSLLRQTASK